MMAKGEIDWAVVFGILSHAWVAQSVVGSRAMSWNQVRCGFFGGWYNHSPTLGGEMTWSILQAIKVSAANTGWREKER
jgi:hypothetical protein